MDLKKYIKKFKLYFSRETSGISFGSRKRVYTDWKIVLLAFSLIAIIAIGWNLYLFYQISTGKALKTDVSTNLSEPSIDKKQLNNTLTKLKDRKDTFENIKSGTSTPENPVRQTTSSSESEESGEGEGAE